MKSLFELYGAHQGSASEQRLDEIAVFDRFFSDFRGQSVRMLEIGVRNGGSLEIWSEYFPNAIIIVGCAVSSESRILSSDDSRIKFVVGDANTDVVERDIINLSKTFDVIIADGSRLSGEVVKSFVRYFGRLNEGGVFIVKDLQSSYWGQFNGGLYYPYSSMAFFKRLVDVVNHEHWGVPKERRQLLHGFSEMFNINFEEDVLAEIHSVEFTNSLCLVRKYLESSHALRQRSMVGQHEAVPPEFKYKLTESPSQASNPWATMPSAPEESWKRLTSELLDRNRQIGRLNQALADSDGQIARLKQEVAALRSSASWRLTAPLRYVITKIRRSRQLLRLLPSVIVRGGGIGKTALKAWRVMRHEGLKGIRSRLRFVATTSARLAIPGAMPDVSDHSIKKFSIIPYYIDSALDEKKPELGRQPLLAVHLHIYYQDMTSVMVERLANIPYSFDLYVSISEAIRRDRLISQLHELLPRAVKITVECVPNRGRDLAPLIAQFGERLSHYEIVGHFHTKKSPHNANLQEWCIELLDHLLGAPGSSGGRVAHIIELLEAKAKIVYPEGRTEFIKDRTGWADNQELARSLLERFTTLSVDDFPVVEFPEGAMFWARGESISGLLRLPVKFDDFPVEPIAPDGTLAHAIERLILILASPLQGHCVRLHRGDSIKDYRFYEARQNYRESIVHKDIKILSYYLPQFHPIPENDAWHGEGFTEWTKVRSANPLFHGHYQQHIPHPDIGYYHINGPVMLRRQSNLMRDAGVYGQIFYHYWFNGKLILEEPARILLGSKDIDMPFCFCWANENWTRRWDGNEAEILLAQNYSAKDARGFIRYLIPFFQDSRYICIDGRPVLYIYRPSCIPNVNEYIEIWSQECQSVGLNAPYIVAVLTRGAKDPADFGMDAGVERVLHDWTAGGAREIKDSLSAYWPIEGSVLLYKDVANYYCAQKDAKNFTYYRSLVPMWDNTARYGGQANVVHDSTPDLFQGWLECLIHYSKQHLPEDRRFIVVNAWNEWAEGAHLEPDSRYGYSYLNSVGRALSGVPYAKQHNSQQGDVSAVRLHLIFPSYFIKWLDDAPELADRFLYGLNRSLRFAKCIVTVDPDLCSLNISATSGLAAGADFILEFRKISFFSSGSIKLLLDTALHYRESVIIPNAYDGARSLVAVNSNQSVQSHEAHDAPVVLYPIMPTGGFKNFKMCTKAHFFVSYLNTLSHANLPIVTTVIRIHGGGDIGLLANALGCLAAMRNCICIPMIAAQDFTEEQTSVLSSMIDDYSWHRDHPPQVHHYRSSSENKDLRSTMLNESLRKIKTRFAAFLDYDDLLMCHAYDYLIAKLFNTGKAVAFGRVYSTTFNYTTGEFLLRSRAYEYGESYDDFLRNNHAPLHSFILDVSKLNLNRVIYHNDQRYLEDYFLTLQLFAADNCDWNGLKECHYIGDYIHSVDREHTLAFVNDSDRQALIVRPDFILCEQRIKKLRASLIQNLARNVI